MFLYVTPMDNDVIADVEDTFDVVSTPSDGLLDYLGG